MSKLGDKFREFTSKPYHAQGVAFLNAYWGEVQKDAENIWKWVHMFVELDIQNKDKGSDLDEFNAHRFLEKVQETKTVKELREQLKAIDLDFNKRMAMIEYCLFRYNKSVSDFVGRPQGDNSAEIAKAQALLEQCQTLLDDAIKKADAARASADAARAAEAEQKAALAEVQSQEDARNKKTEELKVKSEDMNTGVVARNKAKNELAQHLAEDPLPLRKAKITLEAANRKAEKARAAAEADEASANAALGEAEKKFAEAKSYLDEVSSKGGSGQGSVWWLQRELEEKKKYMPKSKGGKW
eukprot:TRINITY_DN5_c0_g1_i3.p1 TRINITY_DN5_c0_g1~~TRINITY_DN5_c0_g1_i3.p1  ORF type:complete len:298 (+),score=93.82 TRINITY_DN5_c0_g1_i3:51-944(+)